MLQAATEIAREAQSFELAPVSCVPPFHEEKVDMN